MTTTKTTAPRDLSATTAARHGLRPATWSAEHLFETLPADGSALGVFSGYGYANGVERFSANNMRRSDDGRSVEVLRSAGDVWGRVLLAYPLGEGRTVRLLVR